jgi:hypothetical protein
MNKARRHELKMLKFKKRLKKYNLLDTNPTMPIRINCFRTTGKPCSCWLCSPTSYKETGLKKAEYKVIQRELNEAC